MPASPDSGNASRLTSLMPLYSLRVVRGGDLRAAVEPVAHDREVHHVGGAHPVVDDVGALRAGALDERRGNARRRDAHVARHGDPLRVEVGDERAADGAGGVLIDFRRIDTADVVGLEDVF